MKNVLFISFIILFAVSCGSDDSKSSSSMFGLGAAAVESLPQVITGSGLKNRAPLITGNISDYTTLANFFKLECFMPGSDNFCPAGTDTSGGDSNPYKLTSYTLIGSIYHADMYSGGHKTACQGTNSTITAGSFNAADTGGNPAAFLLDYYNLLACVEQDTSEYVGSGTKYQTYSVGENQFQATLTTRYRNPYDGNSDPGQNDIFQVYVGISSGEPVFLAYNYAGADSMFQRTVLFVNFETHRFAVKHYESATSYLVAIGVGGINRDTGVLNPGYYYTQFYSGSSYDNGCVDNTTGNFQANTSACTAASIPLTWTDSNFVADYIGMTSDDKTRLSAFLSKFSTEDPLSGTDSPGNNTTDPEQNFPYSITP